MRRDCGLLLERKIPMCNARHRAYSLSLVTLVLGTLSLTILPGGCLGGAPYESYLNVEVTGNGTVTPGSGWYTTGAPANLTATPDAGWHLASWTGQGSASGDSYRVVMSVDREVDVLFEKDELTMQVSVTGRGSVDPSGGTYQYGDTVTLTATPDDGVNFVRWEGDISDTGDTVSFTMDGDKSVTAVFADAALTLQAQAVGGGSVALSPPGGQYAQGTTVTITATPDEGTDYAFIRWEQDATGTTNPLTVTVNSDMLVYAVFETPHTLTVAINMGDGSVSLSPQPDASNRYAHGTVVTITVEPARGYHFDGWGGDTSWSSTDTTIQVTMDANKLITVFFAQDTAGPDTTPKGTVSSRFEGGDEGWRVFGDVEQGTGKPDYLASGGNPGGCLSADDDVQGGTWYWQAPAKFYGNFSQAYGQTLTFDLKQSSIDNQFDNQDVILTGAGITIHLDTLSHPDTSWTSYSVRLDISEAWRVGDVAATSSDIETVLGALEDLKIRGEYVNGPDTGGLDNVVLNAD
jgi:hypothetical protein